MNLSPRAQVISIIIVSSIFGVGYNATTPHSLPLIYYKEKVQSVVQKKGESQQDWNFRIKEQVNIFLNDTIPDAPIKIDLSITKEMYDRGIIFIDARDEEEFAEGHIKGAILAPSTPELVQLFPDRSSAIVTYCSGGDCDVSQELAEELMYDWEYERIFVYLGGWPQWESAGFPIE
jgi:rhodanese-related sulfurtransferase